MSQLKSDGIDIHEISPSREEPEDQDDSSNSSTEKNRKRPLRNRDSNIESKISKNAADSLLFGINITGKPKYTNYIVMTNYLDISERKDEQCQTEAITIKETVSRDNERKKIEAQIEAEYEKKLAEKLDQERRKHQSELKKCKRKQWCALCANEGNNYSYKRIIYILV